MLIALFIVFIVSLLFYLFPPKEMNAAFGYRTWRSKRSQQHWQVANRTASKVFFAFASLALLTGLALLLIDRKDLELIPTAIIFLGLLITLIITERKLAKIKKGKTGKP